VPGLFSRVFLVALPVERLCNALAGHGLVQRRCLVQTAVQHYPVHLVRVPDVDERVRIEHHEVGELAGLERTEVTVETELLRRGNRRRLQRLNG
jgi:hypothetical protein